MSVKDGVGGGEGVADDGGVTAEDGEMNRRLVDDADGDFRDGGIDRLDGELDDADELLPGSG